jgi:hypothetical protein
VKTKVTWTIEELNTAYNEMEDVILGSRLKIVLNWALSNGSFIELTNYLPSFGLRGKSNAQIVSFIRKGEIYVYLNEKKYLVRKERDKLVSDLKKANFLRKNLDVGKVVEGRNLTKKVQDLSENEFNLLLNIFNKYCI